MTCVTGTNEVLKISRKIALTEAWAVPWVSKGRRFEIFSKNVFFLNIVLEKLNFTIFGPPEKLLKNALVALPWKKSF